MKILMVCLGNICRSPLAEGILRHMASKEQVDCIVDSAGTGHWHVGDPPHKGSIQIAKQHGIDISNLRGRQFKVNDFDEFDYIYVMDKSNLANVLALARNDNDRKKVDLIRNADQPNEDLEVADPYYDLNFSGCYRVLNESCRAIVRNLSK